MSETERMMRQAIAEIRGLRRANEILSAQVAVVETFRAAVLGAPRGGGMSPDITWEMERFLEKKTQDVEPEPPIA